MNRSSSIACGFENCNGCVVAGEIILTKYDVRAERERPVDPINRIEPVSGSGVRFFHGLVAFIGKKIEHDRARGGVECRAYDSTGILFIQRVEGTGKENDIGVFRFEDGWIRDEIDGQEFRTG